MYFYILRCLPVAGFHCKSGNILYLRSVRVATVALCNGVTSANHSKYLLTRDAFLFCCSLLTFFFQRWMSRIPLEHGCPRDVLMMIIFLMCNFYNVLVHHFVIPYTYKKVPFYGYDIKSIDRWNKQIPKPVTSSEVTALKLVFK